METTEAHTPDAVDKYVYEGIVCPKCDRHFKNAMALRMHDVRKHRPGQGWDTGKNFRGEKQAKELALLKKRQYNQAMRERFYAQGRNSKGILMPPGWKHKPRHGGNTGMKLAGWSPERREKFNSTWRSKAKQRKARKLPIVYPDPAIKDALKAGAILEEMEVAAVHVPKLKHCPNCGEHIEGWRYQS